MHYAPLTLLFYLTYYHPLLVLCLPVPFRLLLKCFPIFALVLAILLAVNGEFAKRASLIIVELEPSAFLQGIGLFIFYELLLVWLFTRSIAHLPVVVLFLVRPRWVILKLSSFYLALPFFVFSCTFSCIGMIPLVYLLLFWLFMSTLSVLMYDLKIGGRSGVETLYEHTLDGYRDWLCHY